MGTYIILTQLYHDAYSDPKDFKKIAATVSEKIKSECPNVKWKSSFVTMGSFDVLDIVESDDLDQLKKAAMIINGYGHSNTEVLIATPWKEFMAKL